MNGICVTPQFLILVY